MDIKGIIEKMLKEIGREKKRGRASGLCGISGRIIPNTYNWYAFHELMEREFIKAGNKIYGYYWFSVSDDSIEAWYAPRIEFLRKWLDDLNNN
ncbi:MAG: hypothetical protein LBK58_08755 [Prevotellaceae bacterium]|jgi:hypothetical protein|nr:hypothetical protein [Prevotellaceae bacterium]